jgi:hypothetical protein
VAQHLLELDLAHWVALLQQLHNHIVEDLGVLACGAAREAGRQAV